MYSCSYSRKLILIPLYATVGAVAVANVHLIFLENKVPQKKKIGVEVAGKIIKNNDLLHIRGLCLAVGCFCGDWGGASWATSWY